MFDVIDGRQRRLVMSVEVVSPVELAGRTAGWAELAAAAVEPNPFYEPFMMLPAIAHLGAGEVEVLLVQGTDPLPGGGALLCGLFPLERRRFRGLPIGSRALWSHRHCYSQTPLIRAGVVGQVWAALLDWLALDPQAPLLEVDNIAGEGELARELRHLVKQRGLESQVLDSFDRAILRRTTDARTYLDAAISAGRRKELRRQERRLGELGEVTLAALEPGDDCEPWIAELLALEARGWKGRMGTALAASPGDRRFFEEVVRAGHQDGRVMMTALRLDGQALAMRCAFRCGAGSVAFRIAFDERHARGSPGVLLELDNVRRVHAVAGLAWMDSCAHWDHPMIDHLWRDRVARQSLLIATAPGRLAAATVAAFPLARWLRRTLRRGTAASGRASRSPGPGAPPLLDFSPPGRMGEAPFVARHHLVEHRLLTLPRILELCARMPAGLIEYNAGDLPIDQDPRLTPANGLSAVETIRRIADCRSWMVLKELERDPEYLALLSECLTEVAERWPAETRGMHTPHAFLFLSSPGSVTPYHIDPEENFLLQIAGTKTVRVWDGADRSILQERELEQFFGGGHRNLTFRDAVRGRDQTLELAPGQALHIPFTAPHWVKNGPEVSISLSLTFSTAATAEREQIFKMNRWLRRAGMTPSAAGQSPLGDDVKRLLFGLAQRGRRLLRA